MFSTRSLSTFKRIGSFVCVLTFCVFSEAQNENQIEINECLTKYGNKKYHISQEVSDRHHATYEASQTKIERPYSIFTHTDESLNCARNKNLNPNPRYKLRVTHRVDHPENKRRHRELRQVFRGMGFTNHKSRSLQ